MIKLHYNYPFEMLLRFLRDCRKMGIRYSVRGHALVLGPVAICVVWRKEKP